MTKQTRPIKIFYCYAHQDQSLCEALEEHLKPLSRSGIAITWHDRKILAGEDWQRVIDSHLEQADLILLLISSSFIQSNYCYGIELQRALERHELGIATVIPIILRPTLWQQTRLGQFQALPRNGKPITSWRLRDEVFTLIAQEIHEVILQRLSESPPQKGHWVRLGLTHFHAKRYEQALLAYHQAFHLTPDSSALYRLIGEVLAELRRPEEALSAFESCLDLAPDDMQALQGKAHMLLQLQRYQEALTSYQLVLNHSPVTFATLCGMGHTLFALHQYEKALAIYERAIMHFPEQAHSYHYKGIVLMYLTRYEEALMACQQALSRNSSESSFYLSMARILDRLDEKRISFYRSMIYETPGLSENPYAKLDIKQLVGDRTALQGPFNAMHEIVRLGGDDVIIAIDIRGPNASSMEPSFSLEDKIIVPDVNGNIFVYASDGEFLWRYRPDR